MRETEYTFAVARIRCNETGLLTSNELGAVIASGGYDEAVRRLNDKGYTIKGTDYAAALEKRLSDAWELLSSILPDSSQFDSLIIKNDFHNLKVMLKALVCDKSSDGLFVSPSVYDPNELEPLVRERLNDRLPEELRHCDRSAYNILTKTRFAQLSDSVIDRAALEWSIALANKADNPMLSELAQTWAALTDIKVLYRCILAGKAESFMLRSVCACDAFAVKDIVRAASGGMDAFYEFVSHTRFGECVPALKNGGTQFEKLCDDIVMKIVRSGKMTAFGITPLVAYYIAVQTEVKNVRILLSAKLNGISDDVIRERMRELYV